MSDPAYSGVTCCVLYTTDTTYLFPTLVSALQARQHTSRHKADVVIYCVHLEPAARDVFAPICNAAGIQLVDLDPIHLHGQTAMLARLFLNSFVPAHYTDYLYLDGDVHINDSLDPLIDTVVPDGCFLAANDPMTFQLADNTSLSNDLRAHLHSLGLTQDEALHYFNSGILRIRARGWEQTGLDAWQHFERLGHSSRFPDQDALNLAGRGRRLPMSLAWNYPIFFRNSWVESSIRPRITHFMSSPKPWNGCFAPWSQADCEPYRQALRDYPQLTPFYPTSLPLRDRAIYHIQQNGKRLIETLSWGLSQRRNRILEYQSACSIDTPSTRPARSETRPAPRPKTVTFDPTPEPVETNVA